MSSLRTNQQTYIYCVCAENGQTPPEPGPEPPPLTDKERIEHIKEIESLLPRGPRLYHLIPM